MQTSASKSRKNIYFPAFCFLSSLFNIHRYFLIRCSFSSCSFLARSSVYTPLRRIVFPHFSQKKLLTYFGRFPPAPPETAFRLSSFSAQSLSALVFPSIVSSPCHLYCYDFNLLLSEMQERRRGKTPIFFRFFSALFLFPEQTIGAFGPAPFLCILPIDKGRKIPV